MFQTFYDVATSIHLFVGVADLPGRRALRSSSTSRLVVPTFTRSTVAMVYTGPSYLERVDRKRFVSAPSLATFRRRLKHFCFRNPTRTSLFDILLLAPLLLRPGRGAEYCDQPVCLCVCPSMSTSLESLDRSSRNFWCRSAVAVARSSSDSVTPRYVLPVLRMTSRLAVMGATPKREGCTRAQ